MFVCSKNISFTFLWVLLRMRVMTSFLPLFTIPIRTTLYSHSHPRSTPSLLPIEWCEYHMDCPLPTICCQTLFFRYCCRPKDLILVPVPSRPRST